MPNYIDPTTKKYSDMTSQELAFVQMEAGRVAENIIRQNAKKPFLLKLVANELLKEANRLEGQVEAKVPESEFLR